MYFVDRFRLPEDQLYVWGRKPSGQAILKEAGRTGQKVCHLEDGFLRSAGQPPKAPSLSLCVDDLGIYYDSTRHSRLEQLITGSISQNESQQAARLQKMWTRLRLSKYNHALETPAPKRPFILLADQTKGDLSIRLGGASESRFSTMLDRALEEWPDHEIVIKIHPEVASGRKRGHFSQEQLKGARITVCSDGGHPCELLEQCEAVYTVTSQIGFEALLWNKPVFTFGMPFYAGWGLTNDFLPPPERRQGRKPSLLHVVHAVFVRYLVYIDPETGSRTTPERVFTWTGLQRERITAFPDHLEAFGFTPWKARQLRRFIPRTQKQTLRFRGRNDTPRQSTEAALIWGLTPGRGISRSSVPLIRVEDGFIRSAGLGASLIETQSWVFDQKGMYYAAETASSLETLLNSFEPTQADIERAQKLIQRLTELRISKYNLKEKAWSPPAQSLGKRRILVLGQVSGDASIRFGVPPEAHVCTDTSLLLGARDRFQNAWIIYKPHPDVTAGMRRGEAVGLHNQKVLYDECVPEASIASLLDQVDEVCVLTSLGGFEALIRGVPVTVWGLPFYAGWGLTNDVLAGHPWIKSRRKRRHTVQSLAYVCLVEYPLYISRKSRRASNVEAVIEELAEAAGKPSKPLNVEQRVFRWWGAALSRVRHGQNKR